MWIKSGVTGAIAMAMAASPAVAAPAPAAKGAASLSVAKAARSTARTARASKLSGEPLIAAIAGAAVVAVGIYLAVDSKDDSDSN